MSQDQGAEHMDGFMQPNADGVVGPTHTCTHRTLQGQAGAGPAWILVPGVPSPVPLPPSASSSFHAPRWARSQFAGGALEKETLGQGVKLLGK